MKVAIIHYWLVGMRGGEKVLEGLCRLFPSADIYTHVYNPDAVSDVIKRHKIRTTFIQKLPRALHWYNSYLLLMPLALEQIDLRGYDLVISSESGPAKGVITEPQALHVCYCHSPMRYLWDQYFSYLEDRPIYVKAAMRLAFHYLRIYDCASSHRVEKFIANSRYVASKILQYWRRDAEVIYPPVDINRFTVTPENDGYYLWLGKVVRYKKPDLAVEAFNKNGRNLVVLGDGEQLGVVKRMAKKNITFLGGADDATVTRYLERCKALVFSGIEDFGIVPVEAMACGKPVIAFGRGGVTESVIEDRTGVFFHESTPKSLNQAIERFESMERRFNPTEIRRQAERFSETVFMDRIWIVIREAWHTKFGTNLPIANGLQNASTNLKVV